MTPLEHIAPSPDDPTVEQLANESPHHTIKEISEKHSERRVLQEVDDIATDAKVLFANPNFAEVRDECASVTEDIPEDRDASRVYRFLNYHQRAYFGLPKMISAQDNINRYSVRKHSAEGKIDKLPIADYLTVAQWQRDASMATLGSLALRHQTEYPIHSALFRAYRIAAGGLSDNESAASPVDRARQAWGGVYSAVRTAEHLWKQNHLTLFPPAKWDAAYKIDLMYLDKEVDKQHGRVINFLQIKGETTRQLDESEFNIHLASYSRLEEEINRIVNGVPYNTDNEYWKDKLEQIREIRDDIKEGVTEIRQNCPAWNDVAVRPMFCYNNYHPNALGTAHFPDVRYKFELLRGRKGNS